MENHFGASIRINPTGLLKPQGFVPPAEAAQQFVTKGKFSAYQSHRMQNNRKRQHHAGAFLCC